MFSEGVVLQTGVPEGQGRRPVEVQVVVVIDVDSVFSQL